MIDKIFKRWDIGIGNERISFYHCANAAKIKRALRTYLPDDDYLYVNKVIGWWLMRLGQVSYNPDIRFAVERMQEEIYGGASYRVDIRRLKAAL